MKKLHIELGERGYDVIVGSGLLGSANEYFNLNRKVLIITDEGVPENYARTVRSLAESAEILTLPMGEGTKSLECLRRALAKMIDMNMTRHDAVVAVGGGVIGDLSGFAASCYMRGIDFYNVPTTLLSQVDSSIGGKCAVNLCGIKNIVGAFYQPKCVLIDTDTLRTLPERHFSNGLCEAIKMSLTSDSELFKKFESYSLDEIKDNIEDIIASALSVKKQVVEEDEREGGLRKILNFGHTIGHGIEAAEELNGLLHGECVALGMLPMCDASVRERLVKVLTKVKLPTAYTADTNKIIGFIAHDKKSLGEKTDCIFVPSVGSFEIKALTKDELSSLANRQYK